MYVHLFFFFKQKTAYEMRISDWSSDVCSSDLIKIIQAAAVDANHCNFGPLKQSFQSQRWVGRLLPIIGAAPAIAPKPQSDLDIQIFRQDELDAAGVAVIVQFTARRLAQLALNVAFGNRAHAIGIGHIDRKNVVQGTSVADSVDIGGG